MASSLSSWVVPDSLAERYGGSWLNASAPASPAAAGNMTELPTIATAPSGSVKLGLTSSPGLLAAGALGALVIGLVAVSTTVRVGHTEAHAGVGKV